MDDAAAKGIIGVHTNAVRAQLDQNGGLQTRDNRSVSNLDRRIFIYAILIASR